MPASKIVLPMEEIIEKYHSGIGCQTLGEQYHVDRNTILRRLREAGIKPDGRTAFFHQRTNKGCVGKPRLGRRENSYTLPPDVLARLRRDVGVVL